MKTPWAAPLLANVSQWLPPADPGYEDWIAERIKHRKSVSPTAAHPGLFSLLTPVWNTPPEYLRVLAASVFRQDGPQSFEWIVLDNGSTNAATAEVLRNIFQPNPRVRLFRSQHNLGIIGGMRFCLERAAGQYAVAVDHDDRIDPDCLRILAHHIQQFDFPALLYSDEDHLCRHNRLLPYCKPDWDPVLFLNSAYTAHLGVMDRELALTLDVYADATTNSCPDWDAFLRFYQAGYEPRHVPEILYSWRMHPGSTSSNMHSKSDVADSHRAMLTRYLQSLPQPENFELRFSPPFGGTPDWWIYRKHVEPRPLLLISLTAGRSSPGKMTTAVTGDYPCAEIISLPRDAHPGVLSQRTQDLADAGGMVAFVDDSLQILETDWIWEALGLIERHVDIGIVGGRIRDGRGRVVEAGQYFGFEEGCGCPDRGRAATDPGYFHQQWKQRSVDAVSSRFCVCDAGFCTEVLRRHENESISLAGIGHWASAQAAQIGRRVVYSPFLSAEETRSAQDWLSGTELQSFRAKYRDLFDISRYYPVALNRDADHAYQLQPISLPDESQARPACRV